MAELMVTGGMIGAAVAAAMMLVAGVVIVVDRRFFAELPDTDVEDLILTD